MTQLDFISFTEVDRKFLAEVLSDDKMLRYMDLPSWDNPVEVGQMLAKCKNGESFLSVIFYDGDACGVAGFSSICLKHLFAYLTVGVLPPFQGKGVAKEAIARLERLAFEELYLNRLEAQIHQENEISCRMVEQLGFQKEGVMRENFIVNGRIGNSVLYSKLKGD